MKSTGSFREVRIIEIPERFHFKVSAAARYPGISPNSLRKYTDLGMIKAKRLLNGDRLYCNEDLDLFFDSLEDAIDQKSPPLPQVKKYLKVDSLPH